MSDIFISYARSTSPQAHQVAEALRALGYGVWRDDELPPHRSYAEVIEERLASAKAVVVIWSIDAVQSQWVRSEANRGRADGKLVQLAIDGAASKYFPEVEKRTAYLSMLANISTLLGLLGTISGLIVSFAGASQADPNDKATLLAKGISEAMNCTAFGLCIAIPTLLAYAFLQGRTQRIIDDVNEVVLESMNFVISHRDKLKPVKGEA